MPHRRRLVFELAADLVGALVLAVALFAMAVRIALPHADQWRGHVERWAAQALGQPLTVDSAEAYWRGIDPTLRLRGIRVRDAAGRAQLTLEEVHLEVDLLASLLGDGPVFSRLHADGLDLALELGPHGLALGGIDAPGGAPALQRGALVSYWLLSQPELDVTSVRVQWPGAGEDAAPHAAELALHARNDGVRHRLQLRLTQVDGRGLLEFGADFAGDALRPETWRGGLHARAAGVPWTALDALLPGAAERAAVLPAELHAALPRRVDLEAWGTLDAGLPQVVGELLLHRAGDPQGFLTRVGARFDWQRGARGWRLDLGNLQLQDSSLPLPLWLGEAAVEQSGDAADWQLRAGLAALPLQPLRELLLASPGLPVALRELLAGTHPEGQLFDLRLRWRPAAADPDERWRASGRAEALAAVPWGRWPGVDALAGRFDLGPAGGRVELDSRAATVSFPRLFREPLALARLAGNLSWWRDGAGWTLASESLEADNAHLRTRSRLRMRFPADGGSPFVDLVSGYRDGVVAETWRYLPVGIMGPGVVAWLDRALVSGRVSEGGLVLHGRLADFPYDRRQGQFQVRFAVADTLLDYLAGWPRIEQTAAWTRFEGRGMRIDAGSGRIFGARLSRVVAEVDDLTRGPRVLRLRGRADGDLGDGLRYLRESPLRSTFGDYLEVSRGSGPFRLDLGLDLPLVAGTTAVRGRLDLRDDTLELPDFGLVLDTLRGRISFSERSLEGKALQGAWEGMPVQLDVAVPPGGAGQRGGTRIDARGTFGPAQLDLLVPPPYRQLLAGELPWTATLQTREQAGGEVSGVEIGVASDLLGLALELPAPLGKQAADARPSRVELLLLEAQRPAVTAHYGSGASLALRLERGAGGWQPQTAELRLGTGTAQLPDPPRLRLAISGPRLDLPSWSTALAGLLPATGASGRVDARLPLELALAVDELRVAPGWELHAVRLDGRAAQGSGELRLDSREARGRVTLPLDGRRESPVTVDLERLQLGGDQAPAQPAPEAPAAQPPGRGPDPRQLPGFTLRVADLGYAGRSLGRFAVDAEPVSDGLRFGRIGLDNDAWQLAGHGAWRWSEAGIGTAMELRLVAESFDSVLRDLGFDSQLEGATAVVDLDLQWPGGPQGFALETLEGRLLFDLGEGVVKELEAGVGRLFGLVNLGALGRRLRLDFSDLFQRGYAFDSLDASFDFDRGNAYTNDLVIVGPSAEVFLMGRTGLLARDYDQLVTVIPQVSSTLPIAGTLLGGPAVGAALLLFDRLFGDEVNRITRAQYAVTGSWNEPRIERLERAETAPAAAGAAPATPR